MPITDRAGFPYPDDEAPAMAGAYAIQQLAQALDDALAPAYVNTERGPTETLAEPAWTTRLGAAFSSPGAFELDPDERQLIYRGAPRLFAVHAGAHLLLDNIPEMLGSVALYHNGAQTPAAATPPGGTSGIAMPDYHVSEFAGSLVLDLHPGDTLAVVVHADPGFRVTQARISAWSLGPARRA